MKKAILVWLLAIMIILTGCSGNPDPDNSSTPSKDAVSDNESTSDSIDNITEDVSSDASNSDEEDTDDSEWDDEGWE